MFFPCGEFIVCTTIDVHQKQNKENTEMLVWHPHDDVHAESGTTELGIPLGGISMWSSYSSSTAAQKLFHAHTFARKGPRMILFRMDTYMHVFCVFVGEDRDDLHYY